MRLKSTVVKATELVMLLGEGSSARRELLIDASIASR